MDNHFWASAFVNVWKTTGAWALAQLEDSISGA